MDALFGNRKVHPRKLKNSIFYETQLFPVDRLRESKIRRLIGSYDTRRKDLFQDMTRHGIFRYTETRTDVSSEQIRTNLEPEWNTINR